MRCDERGQVTVIVGLFLATMLLGLGLAVDSGQLFAARRAGQIAADAGAWAGAVKLYNGGTSAQAITEATADAAANGFASGSPAGTTVTVSAPPVSGSYNGNAAYVEVTVSQQVPTTFFRGVRALTAVTTRAVAGSKSTGGTSDGVLLLDATSVSSQLTTSGGASLVVSGAGLYANSASATTTNLGSGTTVVTSYNKLRNTTSAGDLAQLSPAPLTGQGVEADPLASLAKPGTGGLTVFAAQDVNNVSTTLGPGIYTGGIRVRGSGSLTLSPGVYVLRGGGSNYGFQTANTASVSGAGVLIFNTNQSYPSAGGSCGTLSLAGTGTLSLTAPASGTYGGIVLWQDAACTGNQSMTTGAGWTALNGTVYLPGAGSRLTITQGASVSLHAQLIVNRLTISNGQTLTLSPTGYVYGSRFPALVE